MAHGEAFGIRPLHWPRRSRCDNCGGANITHGTVSSLMGTASPEQRRAFGDALDWLGDVASGDPDAWLCECGNLGVLSDPVWM